MEKLSRIIFYFSFGIFYQQRSSCRLNMSSEAGKASHEQEDTPLYSASLLAGLDLSSSLVNFEPPLSLEEPGEGLLVRPLHIQVPAEAET